MFRVAAVQMRANVCTYTVHVRILLIVQVMWDVGILTVRFSAYVSESYILIVIVTSAPWSICSMSRGRRVTISAI